MNGVNINVTLRKEKKVIKAPDNSDTESESEGSGDHTFCDNLLETTLPFFCRYVPNNRRFSCNRGNSRIHR